MLTSRLEILFFFSLFFLSQFLSGCVVGGEPCKTNNDCGGSQVCKNGKCLFSQKNEKTTKEQVKRDAGNTEKELTDLQDTKQHRILLSQIEGDGTQASIQYNSKFKRPKDAIESTKRFQSRWTLIGKNLDKLTGLKLVLEKKTTTIFDENNGLIFEQEGSSMKRTVLLPKTLVAGLFLLYGLVGSQQILLAKTFVLQGEKGEASSLEPKVQSLMKNITKYLKINPLTNKVTFFGANIHIENGKEKTNTSNGLGNLIIGYNEGRTDNKPTLKTGSHNVVLGSGQSYSSYGGLVTGSQNTISGPYASVSGGLGNEASGQFSSISGGTNNLAAGTNSSISAGEGNKSYGRVSGISGGFLNITGDSLDSKKGLHSSISGGARGKATGAGASISGGNENIASGPLHATICGGLGNIANGPDGSTVSGGVKNTVNGPGASISGGTNNVADGQHSHISGGSGNQAIGAGSAVVGGVFNKSLGKDSTILGGKNNRARGEASGILGGAGNTTGEVSDTKKGLYATVCGGDSNFATGSYTSILGGLSKKNSGARQCTPSCP
jgi:hypothetical protein